jgi:multidrug efflux pump subunit AcrA (membrane-fusion protein)
MGAAPVAATVTTTRPPESSDAGTAQVLLAFLPAGTPAAPPLAAGTAVQAEIQIAEIPGAMVIPTAAILRMGGARYVLVAGPDNRVMRRDIRLGLSTPQLTQVLEGLAVGEFVITSALTELNEGDLVTFMK